MAWLSLVTRFVPPPYLYAGLAVVLLATHGIAYHKGWQSGMETYYAFKSEVDAANARIAAENERARQEQERIADETRKGWLAAVEYWKRHGGRTVRVQPQPCVPGVPGVQAVPATGPDTDAPPAEQGLGSPVDVAVEQCEARLNNAVLDAAQVIHLQHWIKLQYEASRGDFSE